MAIAVALLVVGVLAGPGLLGPHAAIAPHISKRCGIVSKGSRDYRVRARAVSCRYARRWARVYLRDKSHPRGWRCIKTRGKVPFYCKKGSRPYYFVERL